MQDLESRLQEFIGYLELEMYNDANDVLKSPLNEMKVHPRVLSSHLELLMSKEKWEEGAILGESPCGLWRR